MVRILITLKNVGIIALQFVSFTTQKFQKESFGLKKSKNSKFYHHTFLTPQKNNQTISVTTQLLGRFWNLIHYPVFGHF